MTSEGHLFLVYQGLLTFTKVFWHLCFSLHKLECLRLNMGRYAANYPDYKRVWVLTVTDELPSSSLQTFYLATYLRQGWSNTVFTTSPPAVNQFDILMTDASLHLADLTVNGANSDYHQLCLLHLWWTVSGAPHIVPKKFWPKKFSLDDWGSRLESWFVKVLKCIKMNYTPQLPATLQKWSPRFT